MLPLRREAGERVGPSIYKSGAKQWEGEVVVVSKKLQVVKEENPDTSPSPRVARVPSLSPRV